MTLAVKGKKVKVKLAHLI